MPMKCRKINFEVRGNGCFEVISHKAENTGYARMVENGMRILIHRKVFQEMLGPIPENMSVLHSCDNRLCINPEHMRLGTHQENMKDMTERDRQAKGSATNRNVLVEMQVLQLMELFGKLSDAEISRMYNCSRWTIAAIRHGVTWSHITGLTKKN